MVLQAERAAAAERERLQHEEEERSLAKAQLAKLAKTVRDFEEQSARQSPPPAPAPSGRLGVEAEAAREEAMREMAALERRAAELEQIENEQNASLARAQADLSRSKLAATAAREMMQQAEALRSTQEEAARRARSEEDARALALAEREAELTAAARRKRCAACVFIPLGASAHDAACAQ